MRYTLILLLLFVPTQARAGQFASLILASAAATRPGPGPVPHPGPAPSSEKCENCDGTGKVGDGTIETVCPVCKGTGKTPKATGGCATKAADAASTPWLGVAAILNAINPKPNEVLLDPGCGHDARLLIAAVRFFGTEKAIGIEIDPEIADSARQYVEEAGLTEQIEIITGDSTKMDIEADIGVAYMWPATLAELAPQIKKLDRFASYAFPVPGLEMTKKSLVNGGELYVWTPSNNVVAPVLPPSPAVSVPVSPPVAVISQPEIACEPIYRTTRKTVGLPRGSYCQVCGRRCSNPMAHIRQNYIVGYRESAAINDRGGHWASRCNNGVCRQVWVPN